MPTDDPVPAEQPADDQHPGSSLSVDQLTHAFAQLLDEDHPDRAAGPPATADSAQPQSVQAADEDDSNVTPASILESILFVGHPENEPLTSRLIASYLRGVSPADVDQLITELNDRYRQDHAPYEIVADGPGYRLALRAEFDNVREKFYERIREIRLSQVAVDLLAIVAYHQPISRKEVDELRGRPSGAMLNQLIRRQLLAIERPADTPRKILYKTTDRFLDLFGLQTLDDLPRHDDLQAE